MVATDAFNYEVLDETAFRLVTEMVRSCDSYSLVYSNLDEAVKVLSERGKIMRDAVEKYRKKPEIDFTRPLSYRFGIQRDALAHVDRSAFALAA